jgi:hypothetical protein
MITKNSELNTQNSAFPAGGRECRNCVCVMGVWNGRRELLLCAGYPGHEGVLTQVSGTGVVMDCRRFRPKWEQPAAETLVGEGIRHISVGRGRTVVVDAADFDWLSRHTWHAAGSSEYARATIGGKSVSMHRLIMNAPLGKVVDHINGNRWDNRRSNLRICTPGENLRNARKGRGTSRFKGVFWDSQRRKWGAGIYRDGRHFWLGYFTDEVEAAKAYDRAARELFGAFAHLNFPDSGSIVQLYGRICGHSRVRGNTRIRKSKIRISKLETNSNDLSSKFKTGPRIAPGFRSLENLDLGHCFGFRISCFVLSRLPLSRGPPARGGCRVLEALG